MRIARVFPTKTSMSPDDEDAFFRPPPLGCPRYDKVHVSVTFTWDVAKAERLTKEWDSYGLVKMGGPACGNTPGDFVPGMYLKKGVVITSRGCPNRCAWCLVSVREGPLWELPITDGHIVQDNNLLACSEPHIERVFEMLSRQKKAAVFSGGLESGRVTEEIAKRLSRIRVKAIWLSYDGPGRLRQLADAVAHLAPYFSREKIRCYVLIGYKGDTLQAAEGRLRRAWAAGTIPFAMRYRKPSLDWRNVFEFPQREWNLLTRKWSRPAIIKAMMSDY